ncbi:hypothetical protein C5167_021939 [Papaver somniferum]|uniref:Uncharacterized protein n=1 Tax=Papaver somniferum TaxID=3469 RepID=A0A4Y7JK48_PAPSO|nr:hypothetical protein C5167_021939 [Papaver somniferum]
MSTKAFQRLRSTVRTYHLAEEWSGSCYYSKPDVSDPRTKCLRSRVVPPRPKDEEPKLTTKDRHALVEPYAMDAIRFYNEKQGTNYQLVKPGHMTNSLLSGYLLNMFHSSPTAAVRVQHPRDGGFMTGRCKKLSRAE